MHEEIDFQIKKRTRHFLQAVADRALPAHAYTIADVARAKAMLAGDAARRTTRLDAAAKRSDTLSRPNIPLLDGMPTFIDTGARTTGVTPTLDQCLARMHMAEVGNSILAAVVVAKDANAIGIETLLPLILRGGFVCNHGFLARGVEAGFCLRYTPAANKAGGARWLWISDRLQAKHPRLLPMCRDCLSPAWPWKEIKNAEHFAELTIRFATRPLHAIGLFTARHHTAEPLTDNTHTER